jgi:NAD(P)-dependent dehydrogenase (short-subunit alcohol dehydrogenase family)
MNDLRGTSAIVTGSSSGIGLEVATLLAREGANVALNGRDQTGSRLPPKAYEPSVWRSSRSRATSPSSRCGRGSSHGRWRRSG